MNTEQLITEVKALFSAENTEKWLNYNTSIAGKQIDIRVFSTKKDSFIQYFKVDGKDHQIYFNYLTRGKTSQNIIQILTAISS